ncbi:MAG TPA: phage holin family protein [Micromonosporaceae bacterium]|jgi:hypothetical protein
MTDTDLTGRQTGSSDISTVDLVKQASEQLTRLVRDEIQLARLELREKGRRAGTGIGLFGAGGMVTVYGVGALLAAGILGLSLVLPAWLSALLVGVALLLVAGVMALVGRGQLRRATPPYPREAVEGVRTDAQLLRGRASR